MNLKLDTKTSFGVIDIPVTFKKMKRIILHASPDGTFYLSAPTGTSETRLQQFLNNERAWIVNRLRPQSDDAQSDLDRTGVCQVDTHSEFGVISVKVVRKKVKRVILHHHYGETFSVSVPENLTDAQVQNYLQPKVPWMISMMKKPDSPTHQADKEKKLTDGKTVYFLGKPYALIPIKMFDRKSRVEIDADRFLVYHTGDFEKVLDDFWRKEAERIFKEETIRLFKKYFASRLKTPPPQLSYDRSLSRWGCCRAAVNKITFNELALKYDMKCIEYLTLHELTHLLYSGHGNDFHKFLDTHMPDWKTRRRRLKKRIL